MESVFEHYRTEVMTTRLRRARTKQAAEYEQAALQDLEQKVNDEWKLFLLLTEVFDRHNGFVFWWFVPCFGMFLFS